EFGVDGGLRARLLRDRLRQHLLDRAATHLDTFDLRGEKPVSAAQLERRLDEGVGSAAGRPGLEADMGAFEHPAEIARQPFGGIGAAGELAEQACLALQWLLETADA